VTQPRHESIGTLQNRLGRLAIIVLLFGTIAVELAVPIISWRWIRQPFLGLFFEHSLVVSDMHTPDWQVDVGRDTSLRLVAVGGQPVTNSRDVNQAVRGYAAGLVPVP
jgi:hypothetical protein